MEQFLENCGGQLSFDQKGAIRKNLYHISEIELTARNAGTPASTDVANRCSSLLSKMRKLI